MNNSEKELKDILNKIDNTELIPDDMLEDMDFYQLAYYMQTLNALDSLSDENKEDEENE